MTKTCRECGEIKDAADFYVKDTVKIHGKEYPLVNSKEVLETCKTCIREMYVVLKEEISEGKWKECLPECVACSTKRPEAFPLSVKTSWMLGFPVKCSKCRNDDYRKWKIETWTPEQFEQEKERRREGRRLFRENNPEKHRERLDIRSAKRKSRRNSRTNRALPPNQKVVYDIMLRHNLGLDSPVAAEKLLKVCIDNWTRKNFKKSNIKRAITTGIGKFLAEREDGIIMVSERVEAHRQKVLRELLG